MPSGERRLKRCTRSRSRQGEQRLPSPACGASQAASLFMSCMYTVQVRVCMVNKRKLNFFLRTPVDGILCEMLRYPPARFRWTRTVRYRRTRCPPHFATLTGRAIDVSEIDALRGPFGSGVRRGPALYDTRMARGYTKAPGVGGTSEMWCNRCELCAVPATRYSAVAGSNPSHVGLHAALSSIAESETADLCASPSVSSSFLTSFIVGGTF